MKINNLIFIKLKAKSRFDFSSKKGVKYKQKKWIKTKLIIIIYNHNKP
jgi:hypothetical protein